MTTFASCADVLNYKVVPATIAYTSLHAGVVASGTDLDKEFDRFENPEFVISHKAFLDEIHSSLMVGKIGIALTDRDIEKLYAERDDPNYKEICRLGANPMLCSCRIRWYDYSLNFKINTTYLQLNYTDPMVLELIPEEKQDKYVAFQLNPERMAEALTSPNDLIRRLAHWKLGTKARDAQHN